MGNNRHTYSNEMASMLWKMIGNATRSSLYSFAMESQSKLHQSLAWPLSANSMPDEEFAMSQAHALEFGYHTIFEMEPTGVSYPYEYKYEAPEYRMRSSAEFAEDFGNPDDNDVDIDEYYKDEGITLSVSNDILHIEEQSEYWDFQSFGSYLDKGGIPIC